MSNDISISMTVIGGIDMGKFKLKKGMKSVQSKSAFQSGLKFDKLDKLSEKESVDLTKTEKRLLDSSFVSRGKFHEKRGKNIFKRGPSFNTYQSSKLQSVTVKPQKIMNIRAENIMGMKSNRGVFSQRTVDKGVSDFYKELKKQDIDKKIFARKDMRGKIVGFDIKDNGQTDSYKFNKHKLAFTQGYRRPSSSLLSKNLLSQKRRQYWNPFTGEDI